jgi:hypothetical protein
MDDERARTGRVERYLGDEIVVALPHRELVLSQMKDIGVEPDKQETCPALGLAKLSFTPDQARAGANSLQLMSWNRFARSFDQSVEQLVDTRGGIDNVSDVDKVLLGLRMLFADKYDNWTPVIGKNRYVERVVGQPFVSGGGEGDPRAPAQALDSFPTRPPTPGGNVRVATLDTRIEAHPWLAGAYFVAGSNAVQQPDPRRRGLASLTVDRQPVQPSQAGHATFVAGLILQSAPGAVVELHAVLDDLVDGDTWTLATTLVELADAEVDIVNLSLGTFTDDGQPPLLLQRAIERLSSRIVIVAAAGNHGNATPEQLEQDGFRPKTNSAFWPAAFTEVIAVGAVDNARKNAPFSPSVPWIDVTTLGVGVTSTYLNRRVKLLRGVEEFDGFAQWDGTSFSAAIVSGVIAAGTRPGVRSAQEAASSVGASKERDQDGRPFVAFTGYSGNQSVTMGAPPSSPTR